jgi:hypothetical protein
MPIAPLYDHPDLIALPAAGAGMAYRLAAHFWVTECAGLPKADHELAAIARAHRATWAAHRDAVARILADVIPELQRARAHILARRQGLIAASRAAARARSRAAQSPTPPDALMAGPSPTYLPHKATRSDQALPLVNRPPRPRMTQR